MSKHRARTLLGSGIFRFTTAKGSVYLPLKPELLALVTALNEHAPARVPRGKHRGIVVLAR